MTDGATVAEVNYVAMVRGNSMAPAIKHGQRVKYVACDFSLLNSGDVVVYRNARTRQDIVHRIIYLGPDGWVVKGDRNAKIDCGVRVTKENFKGRVYDW